MRLGSFSTLLLAVLLASPALWHALVVRDMEPNTALLRFLIAVPVAGLMLAFLRSLAGAYRSKEPAQDGGPRPRPPLHVEAVTGEPMPQRRTTDVDTP